MIGGELLADFIGAGLRPAVAFSIVTAIVFNTDLQSSPLKENKNEKGTSKGTLEQMAKRHREGFYQGNDWG